MHYLLAFCLFLSTLSIPLLSTCSGVVPDGGQDSVSTPDCLECPAYTTDEHIVEYSGFVVSYNHQTLVPNWVAYELTADELEVRYSSKSSNFSRDPQLKGRQASREDYSHSGWDKGHMAPKADMRWSERSYWESHYFTNICPQNHQLNGGDWNRLEQAVRRWAKRYGRVWVVCGPVFDSCRYGTIGKADVQIPDAFFKAVLFPVEGGFGAVAYVMPNDGTHHSLNHYWMTVDQLEQLTGKDFFPALDDQTEAAVESAVFKPDEKSFR